MPLKNGHLHYTGDTGTVVYTKSAVLENVPIVLTNPGIWDALGLPLTPFYDELMKKSPLEIVESDIRRALLKRFPFVIYFRFLENDIIRVLLVKHQRRHPSFGMKRR